MDLDRWPAFAAASLLVAALPGPGVANIVGFAINSGQRTALAAVAGAVTGNVVAMTLSLAGVGTLLLASPRAFGVVELVGAAYLVALGLTGILRSRQQANAAVVDRTAIAPRSAFAASVAVSAVNPKAMIFFVAFVPQFIAADGGYLVQCLVLVATFAAVVAASDTVYALLASRATGLLESSGTAVWARRAGGLVLICTGLAAVTAS